MQQYIMYDLEQIRDNDRMLRKTQRDIEKDRRELEKQEKQLVCKTTPFQNEYAL